MSPGAGSRTTFAVDGRLVPFVLVLRCGTLETGSKCRGPLFLISRKQFGRDFGANSDPNPHFAWKDSEK